MDKIFDIFDLDRSGSVEFDEFFLLACMMIAIKDRQAKQFLLIHWRTCFELLDQDGSKSVSREEFETLGFLFNFTKNAVKRIYEVFDVSGNSELENSEFRLFIFAALDMQATLEQEKARNEEIAQGKSRLKNINKKAAIPKIPSGALNFVGDNVGGLKRSGGLVTWFQANVVDKVNDMVFGRNVNIDENKSQDELFVSN